MIKVFISQPMSDRSDEVIESERKMIFNELVQKYGSEDAFEIVPSFIKGSNHNDSPLWYLGWSLQMLSTADVAYFANDWQNYRGCKLEHEAARAYNIPIIRE